MYTEFDRVPNEPVSPSSSVPPVSAAALSTVVAMPVPPALKREIRARRVRVTKIFTVLVTLLMVAMVINGIFSMPDGSFSNDSMWGMLAAMALVLVWRGALLFIDGNTPEPAPYDMVRINEVYEQGAMSTGTMDRVVIPFDEVTSYVETANWIALYSKDAEIVWLADDLTPPEKDRLFAAFAAHLPQTVFTRKSVLTPRKMYETVPPAVSFEPPQDSLKARWSVKEAITRGYAAMLREGAPLFFLMSMVMANVLCDSFGFFANDPFAGRFVLMAAGALLCAGIAWLLIAWEQTAATVVHNRDEVQLLILTDGVRIQDGANFTVIPQKALHYRRDKNGTLCILLGDRVLTVPYPEYSRSTAVNSIFKLY